MGLGDIILRSLYRRWGRMVLLALGLAVGAATVVALVSITRTLKIDVANKMDVYGANLLIVPHSDDLTLSYGGMTVASASYDVGELTLVDVGLIYTIHSAEQIRTVAPKLLGAVTLGGRPVLMAGVQFENELRLKPWWAVVGRYPAAPDEVLVGSRLAELLGLRPGSTVRLKDDVMRVSGVLEPNGSQDDDILFIDLAVSQRLLERPDAVSLVEVAALCSVCPIEEIADQVSHKLPQARVTPLRQAVGLRMETVNQLGRFALAVSVVVVAIGALVVLTTMLGAIAERRQEIGLFRALGFRQQHVRRVVLGEAALVSLVGGIVGWLLGMGAAEWLAPSVAGVTEPVRWDPLLALGTLLCVLAIGLAGSLYPSIRASQLDPVVALRAL